MHALQRMLQHIYRSEDSAHFSASVIDYNSLTDYSSDKNIDLIILSGSSDHSRNHKSFTHEYQLITTTSIPILGICLWCQLIAAAYWATLQHRSHKIKGSKKVTFVESNTSIQVQEAHQRVISELPSTLEWIAKSPDGREIIKHRDKPQLWLQWHPELSGEAGYTEILRFLSSLSLL